MNGRRIEAKTTRYTVAAVWDQRERWEISAILHEMMPPGFFARLDPPLMSASMSDHELAGLKPVFTAPNGSAIILEFSLWKADEDHHLVMFFESKTSDCLPIGTFVHFTEA